MRRAVPPSSFHSSPAIYGKVAGTRGWRYMGALGVLIPIIIYMYYVVIESWCLGYALAYLTGSIDLGSDPAVYAEQSAAFFGDFVGIGGNGLIYDGAIDTSLLLFGVVFAINFALISNP